MIVPTVSRPSCVERVVLMFYSDRPDVLPVVLTFPLSFSRVQRRSDVFFVVLTWYLF